MGRSVRLIRAEEWRTWRSLRLQAVADAPDAFAHTAEEERAHPDEWWIEIVATTVAHPRGALWFAELDDEPVGMCFARVDEDFTTVDMGAMWVAPRARGRGLGKALLDEALDWGLSLGVHKAELWVAAANPEAAGLYRSRGFEPSGEHKPLRQGSPVIAHHLVAPLQP